MKPTLWLLTVSFSSLIVVFVSEEYVSTIVTCDSIVEFYVASSPIQSSAELWMNSLSIEVVSSVWKPDSKHNKPRERIGFGEGMWSRKETWERKKRDRNVEERKEQKREQKM